MLDDERYLDARYRESFAYRAGYLPATRSAVSACCVRLADEVRRRREQTGNQTRQPSVCKLEALLDRDPVVRMYVARMIAEVPASYSTVRDIEDLLDHLDHITRVAPEWNSNPVHRNFFPMSALFTYMMMTDAGESVFRVATFNDALRGILKDWCNYLDSNESRHVLNEGENGWLSKSAREYNKLWQFEEPDGGWPSFNAFFHRRIKPGLRPIAGAGDDDIIVSPNDGTLYRIARGVRKQDQFWLKAQPYSMEDMLNRHYTDRFVDGDVLQSYLSGADYHRWHAPVSGKVVHVEVVDSLMFSNLASEGNDIKGTGSQGYYTAVNTRGLTFIEADNPGIGMVCVVPVGITEVSSIRHTVQPGDHVDKGQEIGRFSYGGSSMAVVFQPGAIAQFAFDTPTDGDNAPTIQVNTAIAVSS